MRRRTRTAERRPAQEIRERVAVISALAKIAAGARDATELEASLTVSGAEASADEGDALWAFQELASALVHAVRWVDGSWDAEPNADRHRIAASLRADAVAVANTDRWPAGLASVAETLRALESPGQVREAAGLLGRVALPPRTTGVFGRSATSAGARAAHEASHSVPAAAILIRLHGEPVLRPAVVTPFALHEFEVEARVEVWPEGADSLHLSFLTVHSREFLQVSRVRFTRQEMRQPLEIRVEGERPHTDRPLTLTARAQFEVAGALSDAPLAGNTTLELVTFDAGTAMPLNMPSAALQLQRMMSDLNNALPNLSPDDRQDIRLLLEGVLRYAHHLLDDRLAVASDVDEAWFQRELRAFLQADPRIGARLSEHTGRAGGITDLALGRIVLELKAERSSAVTLARAGERYAGQAAQYASAADSQVSLLAVLDASPKRAPSGVMGNELAWVYPETTSGPEAPLPSMVGVVVVRAGFPPPSDLSRRRASTRTPRAEEPS